MRSSADLLQCQGETSWDEAGFAIWPFLSFFSPEKCVIHYPLKYCSFPHVYALTTWPWLSYIYTRLSSDHWCQIKMCNIRIHMFSIRMLKPFPETIFFLTFWCSFTKFTKCIKKRWLIRSLLNIQEWERLSKNREVSM